MSEHVSTGCRIQKKRLRLDTKNLSVHQEDAFSSEESSDIPAMDFSMPVDIGGCRPWIPDPPEVTLSALAETGQPESSIPVLNQHSYTGTKPAISSALANTPCAEFGVSGILGKFDAALSTSYNPNTYEDPVLAKFFQVYGESVFTSCLSSRLPHSILEPYIERNDDFGTAYAHLCRHYWGPVTEYLYSQEEWVQRTRQDLLRAGIIRGVPPRCVWDLHANRVVEWHWRDLNKYLWAISHAWMDVKERTDVWTPINGYEWPVPIPKDANLDLIRIEMLNLGADYVWLDVLCLRQPGGPGEHLRMEEWKVDVPTIGWAYREATKVVYYFSGLGRPLSFKPGDFESDRC